MPMHARTATMPPSHGLNQSHISDPDTLTVVYVCIYVVWKQAVRPLLPMTDLCDRCSGGSCMFNFDLIQIHTDIYNHDCAGGMGTRGIPAHAAPLRVAMSLLWHSHVGLSTTCMGIRNCRPTIRDQWPASYWTYDSRINRRPC